MRTYNTNKQGNKSCWKNTAMIRKNYKDFNIDEMIYLKSCINKLDIDQIRVTNHFAAKSLISIREVKLLILKRAFDIIDYNYFLNTKEERVMIRFKKTFTTRNNEGYIQQCYLKIVISINENVLVTSWMNKVEDEEMKQRNLKTNYNNKFDIIKKVVNF